MFLPSLVTLLSSLGRLLWSIIHLRCGPTLLSVPLSQFSLTRKETKCGKEINWGTKLSLCSR